MSSISSIRAPRVAAALFVTLWCISAASPGAVAQGILSYPYLDGSEAAFPAYRAVAEKASRGYVMVTLLSRPDPISREGGGELHTGSGIVLNRDGYILTAAHIARGSEFTVRVRLADGRTLPGQIVKVSKDADGIVTRDPLTRQWTDWIDYWAVDFNYENKREIIRVQDAATGEWEERWTGEYVIEYAFPCQYDPEAKRWLFDEALDWDQVFERWKARGPMNARYIEMVQGMYRTWGSGNGH